jgi:hypothetical protein
MARCDWHLRSHIEFDQMQRASTNRPLVPPATKAFGLKPFHQSPYCGVIVMAQMLRRVHEPILHPAYFDREETDL